MFDELIDKLTRAVRQLKGSGKLSEKQITESLREIRRILLESDVNYRVAKSFVDDIKKDAVGEKVIKSVTPGQQVVKIVYDKLIELLGRGNVPVNFSSTAPSIFMIVGLQGSGKTTFAGKLGKHIKKYGHNPLLVACDIYRPAAIDQLKKIGDDAGIEVFSLDSEVPLKIAQKAKKFALKNGNDTIILDTAGRLHIDDEMMAELKDLKKSLDPVEILYVADGMTGQDAVNSAVSFLQRLDFTGIVLTKLDGDSKGGAALSIRFVTGKPIKFISNGEKLDDIEPFHPERIASRILGMGDVVTLVEKAQEVVDKEEAERLTRKLEKEQFTLEDFYGQMQQIKKMGSLSQIAAMLPGMGSRFSNVEIDERAMVQVEAIINSMTKEERRKPAIINGSRRRRIAAGSGTTVQDVNRLLKQFQMMKKMMKQMKRSGPFGFNRGMPF